MKGLYHIAVSKYMQTTPNIFAFCVTNTLQNWPKTAEKQIESNVDTKVPCVGKVSQMTCQLKKAPTPPKVLGRNTSALVTY